jgi:hypothetical protein
LRIDSQAWRLTFAANRQLQSISARRRRYSCFLRSVASPESGMVGLSRLSCSDVSSSDKNGRPT